MSERKTKQTYSHPTPPLNMKGTSLVCLIFLFSFQLFGQKLIPYLSHGKYGYADPQGQIRIAPVYDEVEFFDRFDVAAARLDTQWFLINLEGTRLVKLETKNYSVYLGLSALGPTQYGSRKNIDTIPNLLRHELFSRGRRYINIHSGRVSPLFPDFDRIWDRTGMLTGFEGILYHGIYIGQTGEKEYMVMNSEASIIATTSVRPIRLNDSLVSYMKDDISVILNIKTNESFSLPYYNTSACIPGTNFIVSNIHESWDYWNSLRVSLEKGLVDRNGTVIIQPQYDDLMPIGKKLLLAKKGDFNFLITPEGKKIDSNLYRHVFEIGDTYYQAQLPNQKWIFLDAVFKKAIPGEFDEIDYNQICECFFVNAGDTASILTSDLSYEISNKADAIYRSGRQGYYIFERNGKTGLLDQVGNEIIPALYEQCNPSNISDIVIIQQDGLKGIMSLSGSLLMAPQFEDIRVEMLEQQPYLLVKKNGMYAYFDAQLNQLSDFQPKYRYLSSDPIIWERDENDFIHLYNRFGQPLGFTVNSISYGNVESDSTYLMLVHKNDSSFLFYDKEGKLIIDTLQLAGAQCYNLESGLIGVRMGDEEGVQNHLGQWIVPPGPYRVAAITPFIIVVKEKSKYSFYAFSGKRINTLKCSSLSIEPYQSVWDYTYKNKNGFISAYAGKTIVPPKFDDGFFHHYNCIIASIHYKNGSSKSFAFDSLGHVQLRTSYDDMHPIDYNGVTKFYSVRKNGKAGLIDARGQIRISLIYKSVSAYDDTTFFTAYDENKKGYIYNSNGDIVFSGTTLPVGREKIELPNGQIYFTNEYDKLPGHNYLFYYTDYCLIVDHLGRTLKKIDNINVKLEHGRYPDERFIEVKEKGQVYLIDPVSLVSFREETNK